MATDSSQPNTEQAGHPLPPPRQTVFNNWMSESSQDHWSEFINRTSIHGPREVRHADYSWERYLFAVLLMLCIGWTLFNTGRVLYEFAQFEKTTYMEAISPTSPLIFDYVRIAYCASDWLDRHKAASLKLSPTLMEYMELLLRVTVGEGVTRIGLNFSDPKTVDDLLRGHYELNAFLNINRLSYNTVRDLYESIATNFSTFSLRKKLCPEEEGNFCFYPFTPQSDNGYTIRKGRVCQVFAPLPDEEARNDPLAKVASIDMALKHVRTPAEYGRVVTVAVRPTIGEVVTTGLSPNASTSFHDLLSFDAYAIKCNLKLTMSVYKFDRKPTKYDPCSDTLPKGYRLPQNYPPAICRLLCVDKAYFISQLKCAVYFPLYNITYASITNHDHYNILPLCSPMQLREAQAMTFPASVKRSYEECLEDYKCHISKPCVEWVSQITVNENQTPCERSSEVLNTTEVTLQIETARILHTWEVRSLPITQVGSRIGGVMGLALGASVTSVLHFIIHAFKHIWIKLKTVK